MTNVEEDRTGAYYDDFLKKRMVHYRINGNLRIEAAARLLESVVRDGFAVADLGCGIGIIVERLGKRFPRAKVIGVDISAANIEYARKTISLSNVKFIQASVTEQFERLLDLCPGGFDAISLIDVIEHIPVGQRQHLFENISKLTTREAILVITYPSPEYQRYLLENNQSELQLIDNIVEPHELLTEVAPFGWKLRYFSYVDVWRHNQYIHVVFFEIDPSHAHATC